MRAKVDLRVEILDGDDAGYVLEEKNKVLDLDTRTPWGDVVAPYRVTVEFVTPNLLREWRERQ